MKIIDLLNKIANGEEVPKEIKYNNSVYTYNNVEESYEVKGDEIIFDLHNELSKLKGNALNDEVEIIEEDIKENPTFEEYMENPEKYWNNLLEKLDEIKQYLKND